MTDPDLHDSDLLEEIELLGELVIAASDSQGLLPAARVDTVLGIRRREATAEVPRPAPTGSSEHASEA